MILLIKTEYKFSVLFFYLYDLMKVNYLIARGTVIAFVFSYNYDMTISSIAPIICTDLH